MSGTEDQRPGMITKDVPAAPEIRKLQRFGELGGSNEELYMF